MPTINELPFHIRVGKGLAIGAGFGFVVSMLAIVAAIVQGSTVIMVRGAAVSIWWLILTNMGGCTVSGAVLGLLTPFARSAWSAYPCSFAATLPLATGMALVFRGGLDRMGVLIVVTIGAAALAIPASNTLRLALREH